MRETEYGGPGDRVDARHGDELFDASSLARHFVVLTHALLDTGAVADVLERVVYAAQEIVPGATW